MPRVVEEPNIVIWVTQDCISVVFSYFIGFDIGMYIGLTAI